MSRLPYLALVIALAPIRIAAQDRNALNDIVGVWQSDTVGGVWALSSCAASPQGDAVICEQQIATPTGARHALNAFMIDSSAHRYVYYGINRPGSVIQPVPLSIANHVWVYGGGRESDGTYYRTVNDFSAGDSYVWRQETSRDSVHWTAGRHGRAVRVATAAADWCRGLPRPQYAHLRRVPSPDPWFEVYAVAPATYAIYEPHQAEEAISFLILGTTRAALFDTGLGIGDIKRVVSSLTTLPITVLNSHTHDDHVGDNWEFNDVWGMETDFTRTNAKGSVVDAQDELSPGSVCGQLPAGFDPKTYATRPFHITRWVHDGDSVDLGGRTLRIIATLGHTPDAMALFDEQNGLLFTGDTYYPGTIWLYRPETDLAAYEHSVQRLVALEPRVRQLLTSHNAPVADPSELTKVLAAIRAVRAGQAVNVEYHTSEGITFLMRTPR